MTCLSLAAREAEQLGMALEFHLNSLRLKVMWNWSRVLLRSKKAMRAIVTVSQGSRVRDMGERFTVWEAWTRRKEVLMRVFLGVREKRLHTTVQMYFVEWLRAFRDRVCSEDCLCKVKSMSIQSAQRNVVSQWVWWAWTARRLRKHHQVVAERNGCMLKKDCFVGWAGWSSMRRTNRQAVAPFRQKGNARLMGEVYCGWFEQVEMHKIERVASLLQCEDDMRPQILPFVAKCLATSSVKTFGLMWGVVGDFRPHGQKLINSRLAAALKEKTNFTEDEWLNFGIQGLRADHYIKSGGAFYKPLRIEGCAEVLANEVLHLERAARISKLFDHDIPVNAAASLLGDLHVFWNSQIFLSLLCWGTCTKSTLARA